MRQWRLSNDRLQICRFGTNLCPCHEAHHIAATYTTFYKTCPQHRSCADGYCIYQSQGPGKCCHNDSGWKIAGPPQSTWDCYLEHTILYSLKHVPQFGQYNTIQVPICTTAVPERYYHMIVLFRIHSVSGQPKPVSPEQWHSKRFQQQQTAKLVSETWPHALTSVRFPKILNLTVIEISQIMCLKAWLDRWDNQLQYLTCEMYLPVAHCCFCTYWLFLISLNPWNHISFAQTVFAAWLPLPLPFPLPLPSPWQLYWPLKSDFTCFILYLNYYHHPGHHHSLFGCKQYNRNLLLNSQCSLHSTMCKSTVIDCQAGSLYYLSSVHQNGVRVLECVYYCESVHCCTPPLGCCNEPVETIDWLSQCQRWQVA